MMYPHTIILLIWWEQLVFLPRCHRLIIKYHWCEVHTIFSAVFRYFSSTSQSVFSWQWGVFMWKSASFLSFPSSSYSLFTFFVLSSFLFSCYPYPSLVFLCFSRPHVLSLNSFFFLRPLLFPFSSIQSLCPFVNFIQFLLFFLHSCFFIYPSSFWRLFPSCLTLSISFFHSFLLFILHLFLN